MTDSRFRGARGDRVDCRKGIASRHLRDSMFRFLGLGAVILSMAFLLFLLLALVWQGHRAFFQHYLILPIHFDEQIVDPSGSGSMEALSGANYRSVLLRSLSARFPGIEGRAQRSALLGLLSSNADLDLRSMVLSDPSLSGQRREVLISLSATGDMALKDLPGPSDIFATEGKATLSILEGDHLVIDSNSDDFSSILNAIEQDLERVAVEELRERRKLEAHVESLTEELLSAQLAFGRLSGEGEKEWLEARPAGYGAAVKRIGRIYRSRDLMLHRLAQVRAAEGDRRDMRGLTLHRVALTGQMPSYFVRINGGVLKLTSVSVRSAEAQILYPLDSMTEADPGTWTIVKEESPQAMRKITDQQLVLLRMLSDSSLIRKRVSKAFFTGGASREPERAGILGSVLGSLYTMLVMLMVAFPIGVAAAVYLEEFAPRNRWTDWIEVNVANLAAVPSVVFGLLGLAIFLDFFAIPRSVPVAGGLVLALATFPTIIIAGRSALKSIPVSVRQAALAVGASHFQSIFHHVLPAAFPGILTGTIIGVSQALGETAPLLMIGMLAFVSDIPEGLFDVATALPVQIYMWSDFPEAAFREKTAAAILVLLGVLIMMNAFAVFLRERFGRDW